MHTPIPDAMEPDKWVERLNKEHNLPYWVNLCRGPRRGLKTWTDPNGLSGAGEGLCTVLPPPSVQRSAASDSFYGSDTPLPPPPPLAKDVFEREGSKSLITHSRPLNQTSSDFMTSSIGDTWTRPPDATDRTDDDLAVAGPSSIMAAGARPPPKGRRPMPARAPAPAPASTAHAPRAGESVAGLTETLQIIGELDDITDAIQLAQEEGIAATAYAGLDLAAMKALPSKHFFF